MGAAEFIERFRTRPLWRERSRAEKGAVLLLFPFAFFLPLSIAASQVLVVMAFFCWLLALPKSWHNARESRFFLPLVLFALLSLISVVFSYDPGQSLWNSRNLMLLLIALLASQTIRDELDVKMLFIALGSGAVITTAWGIVETFNGNGGGENGLRLRGTLGHYMTAGGELMIIALIFAAVALWFRSKTMRIVALSATLFLLIGLAMTQSRNAYVGAAAGMLVLLLLWRKGVVFLLPFALSLIVLASPDIVRERIFHIADLSDASVVNRLNMAETGMRIIADFPLFGVGPQQVERVYERYRTPEAPPDVPHLHNNFVQLAAERGVPAMLVWTWLMISIGAGHLRLFRKDNAPVWLKITASAGLAAVVALVTAGLFEYNFGDSEVLMLFLLVVSVPYGIYTNNKHSKNEKKR